MQAQCLICYSYLSHNGDCPVCQQRKSLGRGRSYHRYHRARVIKKRQNIIKHVWGDAHRYDFVTESGSYGSSKYYKIIAYESLWTGSRYNKQPGRLAKHNLSCNCDLCKWEKHWGPEKIKYRLFKESLLL
ncbi:hypothetical protein SAMN05660649_01407 [Desulfotomaculum arcticum]|uniref:Uncharacterized protein n=1 Tax=Desulfotruncus arcticus DSM 17038 TaxID=1121424 RepID=A0A1I2R5I1_9FIRM|nr:hypothetical protein SAMN05660649_01407 [Desulfotomaculum arcticum] [Desulfotruncus arcticus DSM 17038]